MELLVGWGRVSGITREERVVLALLKYGTHLRLNAGRGWAPQRSFSQYSCLGESGPSSPCSEARQLIPPRMSLETFELLPECRSSE